MHRIGLLHFKHYKEFTGEFSPCAFSLISPLVHLKVKLSNLLIMQISCLRKFWSLLPALANYGRSWQVCAWLQGLLCMWHHPAIYNHDAISLCGCGVLLQGV